MTWGPNPERLHRLVESVKDFNDYIEEARNTASKYITLSHPNNYDPGEAVSERAYIQSFKWHSEAQGQLADSGVPELETFAERMRIAEHSLVEESEADDPLYKSLYLLVSTQDGLITWLCRNSEIEPNETTADGEEIYQTEKKKDCIDSMYQEYDIFQVEEGHIFRAKWESFWQHRHRIMHGHPEAYFDDKLGVAAMFFVALTANIAIGHQKEPREIDQ